MSPTELTHAARVGQVIAAIALQDASAFHALDDAIVAGTMPSDSVGKVQRARLVTAATQWPEPLAARARELVEHLGELHQALRDEEMAKAVEHGHHVHEIEHDLSQGTYAWLGQQSGMVAGAGGH
jgi:hypothetical protein